MRLSLLLSSLLVCGVAALLPLHAQTAAPASPPASPYAVTVPVVDTSEMQRDQAFTNALGQVLARVAGGQDLRDKAGYDDALKGAPGLVQQFQYQRAGTGLALQVNFDPGAVRRLVAQLGVPAAGVKPPVLLMVQGSDGSPLGPDSLDALAQAAAARGYRVIYADPRNTPEPASIAAVDPAALAAVTRQYQTGLILLGNLGRGTADWTLVSGGQSQHWSATGTSEDAMLAAAANSMIDRLGQQLNVIGARVSEATLWVANVNSAMDYANLLATLRADPSVREVTTLGAQDTGMLLRVKAALPADALAASLAAGGRLLLAPAHAGADTSLRWLH